MNKVNESDILDLVIEDLVFVTFDFRRNVFGFLEIEGASYNVGLKGKQHNLYSNNNKSKLCRR